MRKPNFSIAILIGLMVMAFPLFGQFATTTLSPSAVSIEQGATVDVDMNWSIAFNPDPTIGFHAWLNFDPAVFQATSISNSGTPYGTEEISTIDNAAGTIEYRATGSGVTSGDYTIATITFTAVGSGTSLINYSNVHQLFQAYGAAGINGQASGTSIDVIACTPTEQTFTVLGAYGTEGTQDPYIQALPEGATEWTQAYLTGWHPWGFVDGTNSWLNFDPSDEVGTNTATPYRIRFVVPDDYTDPSMVFQVKADNLGIIWVNDTFIDSVEGAADVNVPDATIEQALNIGMNEIRITMVDWGSIVGLNYRIDVTMTSCEDISDAVLTPEDAAELNNAPTADAGPDQTNASNMVSLDGSGSSDPDANILVYTWSTGGSDIAMGVNPTVELPMGMHDIILTVTDGELSDTDTVSVNVTSMLESDIEVTLTPIEGTEVVSAEGGTIWYDIMLANNTEERIRYQARFYAEDATGHRYGPLRNSSVIVSPGGSILTRTLRQNVPSWISAGDFDLYCLVGNASNSRIDSSGFSGTKLGNSVASAGRSSNDWKAFYSNTNVEVHEGDVWMLDASYRADGTMIDGSIALSADDELIPQSYSLSQNYPNPFNPSTTINFALESAGDVSLRVFDITGAEVAQLASGHHEAGAHQVHFTAEGLSNGVYLYVLEAGSFRQVKQMVYLK